MRNVISAILIVSVVIWSISAEAALIHDFTFSGTNINGSGTVEFDGAGNIIDLDMSGTAWADTFTIVDEVGQGTVGPDWEIDLWTFQTDAIFSDTTQHVVSFLATGLPNIFIPSCISLQSLCNGMTTDATIAIVTFQPRGHPIPEPRTFGLFLIGIAGLGSILRGRQTRGIGA